MPLVKLQPDVSFEAKDGQSIVDAALGSGLFFPYSCKTGRCNSCMCKLESGQTRLLQDELALTHEQREEGWILGCARTAVGSVTLRGVDIFPFQLPPLQTIPCRIDQIERYTSELMRVVLRLPPGQALNYLPGQYVDVIKDGVRRSYSIANAPRAERTLELHIKRFDGGAMSHYWFEQAKVQDLLRLRGPSGTFFLRDLKERDVVFLATGTGYAPVKAMLEQLQQSFGEFSPRSVSVYRGVRSEEDLYAGVPDFGIELNYVPVLSRPGAQWQGARGYVQDACLSASPGVENSVFYACGSDKMISDAKSRLLAKGLAPGRFFSDAFVCTSTSH
jgi:CDP-4-dehydro-6-deoxyglucose reductase